MAVLNRILHIEDEPDIREIARIALETIGGYQVHQCEDGIAALAEAEGFAPDLMIIDVMMPRLSGPETLAELRKIPSLAAVPVIFMTAKVQKEEVDALLKLGILGVIQKPFEPIELPQQVARLWEAATLPKAS